jgi:prepilin-type N-terminal cleavage/methylation domain-containing protein
MRGFTLVEMLVVIALTAIIFPALAFLVQYFYKTSAYALQETQAVASARASIVNTERDLREATYGADGAYPIASAATSSITFYASLGTTSEIDKVHYYVSGTTLYRGITAPTSSPPTYAGQPENISLVIDNIRNDATTPLFTYYDTSGAALASPIDVSQVASVRIKVLTDVNPYRAPNVYTMLGSATLRNLKAAL